MPDLFDEAESEWMRDPEKACQRFLEEMGTSTHIMQQGFTTMILTKLRREELADYLYRLYCAVNSEDENRRDDIRHIEVKELGNGETQTAAILVEEVS